MRACLKYARIFWVAAVLVMAAGQALHAMAEAPCPDESVADCSSRSPEHPGCPANHSCCSLHGHYPLALAASFDVPCFSLSSGVEFDWGRSPAEGPAREIEHPPQLS